MSARACPRCGEAATRQETWCACCGARLDDLVRGPSCFAVALAALLFLLALLIGFGGGCFILLSGTELAGDPMTLVCVGVAGLIAAYLVFRLGIWLLRWREPKPPPEVRF